MLFFVIQGAIMLLNFSVSNWKSFRGKTSLSMVASKEKQHASHIQYLPEYKLNVLPIAVVFGANASGKSNLVKAIEFAVAQITSTNFDPYHKEQVDSFRIDPAYSTKNSEFEFTFTVDDLMFHYGFALRPNGTVAWEKLERARGKRLKLVYERNGDGKFEFESVMPKDARNAVQGTLKQRLALSYMQIHNVPGLEELKKIYFWFRFKLVVLTPASRLIRFTDAVMPTDKLSRVLHKLDTSIEKIDFKPFEDFSNFFPKDYIAEIVRILSSGTINILATGANEDFYKFEFDNGELKCFKMISYHHGVDGSLVSFELSENSDGTRRCLHLFPAFNELVSIGSDCCYVIDELDRSLHTNLVKQLLASFLETRNQDTRSQLILTNHDIEQMDQDVLRRDEIWIAERNAELGATELSSLDEFIIKDAKIRKDRNLPKLYLDGCLGGVPNIESYANLFDYANEEPNG